MQGRDQKEEEMRHTFHLFMWALLYLQTYNLGTGKGYSVLQMVKAMEKASGREVSDLSSESNRSSK